MKTPVFSSGANAGISVAFNLTRYLALSYGTGSSLNATESVVQTPIRTASTLSNAYFVVASNSIATSASTITSRVNAGPGNISISIAAGATGAVQDASNTDTLSAGDLVNWRVVTPNTSGTLVLGPSSYALDATGVYFAHWTNALITQTINNSTRYGSIAGAAAWGGTAEANVQSLIPCAGTLKNFSLNVSANARAVVDTATIRVNGADTGITISTTASTTGVYEDTSNTAAVVAGDLVNAKMVYGASGGSITFLPGLEWSSTAGVPMIGQGGGTPQSNNLTRYQALGGATPAYATETDAQLATPVAATWTYSYLYVATNTLTASSTVRSRVNTAPGNQTFSIGSSATGLFSDLVNTDAVAANDVLDWSLVTGATGTSLVMAAFGSGFLFPTGRLSRLALLGVG